MQNKALLYSIAGALFVIFALAFFNPGYNTAYRIVLRIGKVSVTEYELEKNLAIFSDDFAHKNGHAPAAPDIANWIQSFVDRTYFLADAYEKGYDTLSEVKGWVQSMEHYMISKKGGLLDEKMDSGSTPANKQEMQSAYYDQVKKEAKIKINPYVLSELVNYLKDKKIIRVFEKNNFANLPADTVFTFNMMDRSMPVPVTRFMDYYNTLPIRKEIKNPEGLVFYMESMVYDTFAYWKAEELGITKEPKMVMDRENYKKNVIWASYERKELRRGITVSDDEVLKKYRELKDSLVQATDVVVSTWSFASRKDAFMAMVSLKTRPADSIRGMEILDKHRSIHYQEVFFGDTIRALLFSMKNNDMSMPIPFADRFIVIVKESESGRRIQAFHEVKDHMVKKIESEKLVRKKDTYLAWLKKTYTMKNEIEYQKYVGSVYH